MTCLSRWLLYSRSSVLLLAAIGGCSQRENHLNDLELLSSLAMSVADEHAVVFVQVDWAILTVELAKFREFAANYRQVFPEDATTFRIINFSEVTNGYAPLAKLPGWDEQEPGPNSHQINGVGEVIWLRRGRIVNMTRLDVVDDPTELIRLTRQAIGEAPVTQGTGLNDG